MNFLDPRLPMRFWNKCSPEPTSGCWLWIGATSTAGYGNMTANKRYIHAHRAAYEAANGSVPPGLELDHLCRVRCCCNPLHLEAVTHRENCVRGVGPIAANARKQACPAGHPYSDANTWFEKNGYRHCRECKRQRDRRYHEEGRR